VWNTFFALIQLGIGLGLLYARTVRPALVVSFFWAAGVWVFGEGLGMIFTGTASPLTGAPGAVLLYGLLGLMAWPRSGEQTSGETSETTGVASSAAGSGIGGALTPLAVWSGLWILSAILFLLPANRTATSISSAVTGMAPGTPGWYGHLLTNTGSWLGSSGATTSWILAIISVIIGVGPLLVRRPGSFLFLGGLFAAVLWIMGQGWLGGILSGSGTDPNIGPLIIVLALAMVPARVATDPAVLTPAQFVFKRRPGLSVGAIAVVGAALALSATYPVAADESTTTAMSGMAMAGSSSSSSSSASASATESTCTKNQTGMPHAGLDLNNTPYMVMSGHLGMDMNGADASAAAGLNTTKANWHYSGPALPAATASVLLAQGSNSPDTIHMAMAGCAKSVSATELLGSTQYVQSTSQAAAQYATPAEAMAAGYVAVTPTDYPVVTYVNPAIVTANAAAKRTMDPAFIDGLVYATVPSGQSVLVAAMYILPSTLSTAPMPYGALVQWHQRTNVCVPTGTVAGATYQVSGIAPCAPGTVKSPTPYVTYVWQVPVAGGPLAIQPPDIQIVQAAVMASS